MIVLVAVLVPVAIGWAAAGGYWYAIVRRRRRWRAEWEAAAPGLAELDRELDQVWATEQPRRRP